MSLICWIASALIFFALGLDLIQDTGKVHLDLIALGLIPLGLALGGVSLPRVR